MSEFPSGDGLRRADFGHYLRQHVEMSLEDRIAWEREKRAIVDAKLRANRLAQREFRLQRELGEDYAEATLETHRIHTGNQRAVELARSVIDGGFERGAGFFGTIGNGKTRLAACIARAAIMADRSVRFVTMQGLLDEVKAAFDDEGKAAAIYGFAMVDVLVVDDLGKQYRTEFAATTEYDFWNMRSAAKKPVFVTANCSPAALMELYAPSDRTKVRIDPSLGEAVLDRVFSLSGGASNWCRVVGRSERKSA
jgi:DNA replication protein DnaC